MQKFLIILGIVLIIAGLFWTWLVKIPLFKLPGDFVIDKPNFKFYFPLTSMIIISVILSLILWIFRK